MHHSTNYYTRITSKLPGCVRIGLLDHSEKRECRRGERKGGGTLIHN